MTVETNSSERPARRLLLGLYLLEASLLLALFALRAASVAGAVAGGIILALSAAVVVASIRSAGPGRRRRAATVAVATNLLTLALLAAVSEVGLRTVARPVAEGLRVGDTLVPPSWAELVARSERVLDGREDWDYWPSSYYVFDPQLGWTVGPDRATADGMAFSSLEGFRASGPGQRLTDRQPRARVALIGDSNAFSSEVRFEESLGHHLDLALGPEVEVLNLGVDGYGPGQMLLRYERDARPLEPDVVLVAFTGHDLLRTMSVYPFITFGWPGYVVKPRFTLDTDPPAPVNLPLPSPGRILDATSIEELPWIELEPGFVRPDWTWRKERIPLLLRFLDARFPRWSPPPAGFTPADTETLNARILARLATVITEDGARPLVVLLSSRRDDLHQEGIRILERAGVQFLDGVGCLERIPEPDRLVTSGIHLSGRANAALAEWVAPVLEPLLRP